jgi:hypothetical protein
MLFASWNCVPTLKRGNEEYLLPNCTILERQLSSYIENA